MRFETFAITYATLCTCRRLNKMPGHNVLCCAALRGATSKVVSMQHVSFLLLYRFFPSFHQVSEKSGMSRKKKVLREKFGCRCRTAWLERAGSAGQEWRAWPGWGQGRGGGERACSYIKTCIGVPGRREQPKQCHRTYNSIQYSHKPDLQKKSQMKSSIVGTHH